MSEYRREIAVRSAVVFVLVIGLAFVAMVTPYNIHPSETSSANPAANSGQAHVTTVTTIFTTIETHTYLVPGQSTTSITSGPSNETLTKLLLGIVYPQNVSCSLANASCTMTMENAGNTAGYDVVIKGCYQLVIAFQNSTTTEWNLVSGSINGQVVSLPAGGQARISCSVPLADLTQQSPGSHASGTLTAELINYLYSNPPGSEVQVSFEGTWT